MSPDRDDRQRHRIVARQDAEILRGIANDIHDLSDISGGLFHRHNVWNLRQPKHGFSLDISAGPAGTL